MMMQMLAETGAADPMISGAFVLKIIGAIFSGVVLLLGGRHLGKKEERQNNVTIKDQPVNVRTHTDPEYVTTDTMNGHLVRIDDAIAEIKEVLDGERTIARTANGNIHKRLDALSERLGDRLSKLEGTSESVRETVDKLLDIALGKPTTPPRK